jgi:hypothetical protein
MSENSFENLVKDLPSDEKKELLDKVSESVMMPDPELPAVHYTESSSETAPKVTPELDRLAKTELAKMNFFERLIMKIKILIFKKDLHTIILEKALLQIRTHIEEGGHYVDFDKKQLTPRFAKELYTLFRLSAPLRPVFQKIWRDPKTLEQLLNDFLSTDNTLSIGGMEVESFASVEQMLDAYMKNLDATDVRRLILRNLKNYTDSIPETKFRDIKTSLLPFYDIQQLVTFPFHDFFTLFGVSLNQSNGNTLPDFMPTPVSVVIDYLLKFSYAVSMASNLQFDEEVAATVFKRYFLSEELHEDEIHKQVEVKIKYLKELNEAVKRFNRKIYLIDILRYFQQNPFFTLSANPPRLNLKQFYSNALRLMIFDNFNEAMLKVRLAFINYSIDQLFKGRDLVPLNYYITFTDKDWIKLHLPLFRHAKSMMLVYNFLRQWYRTTMAPVVVLLSNTVLAKSAVLQSKLNELKNAIENIEEKIRRFDQSLTPETEAGKTLALLKASLRENTTQLRLVRSFISQKDIEAGAVLNDAVTAFNEFIRFLKTKVTASGIESIRTSLASVYPSISRSNSLNETLNENLTIMQNFAQMIKELLTYENMDEKPV